jgi:drug/metabolite transporter (DMT)-like permease
MSRAIWDGVDNPPSQIIVSTDKAALPSGRLLFTALLIANLALSFGPLFVRMADTGPTASAFWRLGLATPLLFLLAPMARQPVKRLPTLLVWTLALSGLFFAADLASWHFGILKTKLANANLLANSASFLFPLYGFIVARSLPSRAQGLALALAALGTALLMGRSYQLSPDNFTGDLLCFLAGVFYVGYLVVIGHARTQLDQWPVLAWTSLAGALPLLLFATLLGEAIWPTDWTPLLLLALLSQVIGQGLMVYVLGRLSPLVIGLALLTQPVLSAAIGWQFYGETLGAADFAGALLIGLALILVRQPDKI